MQKPMHETTHQSEDRELRQLVETMIGELRHVPVPASVTALAHQLQTLIDKRRAASAED